MEIENSIVLVTGSARRLGKEIALGFAREGANLIVHHSSDRSSSDAEATADQIRKMGRQSMIVQANQASQDEVTEMFLVIQEEYGRIDVLINSAAVFGSGEFLSLSATEWDRVLDINLRGPFLLTQTAAKLMLQSNRPGVVINISDNSGINGWANRPHHSVSKAGVIMLTRVAAQSMAQYGIRVNCIVPGPVLPPADGSSSIEQIADDLPLGKIGSPRQIADACIFLAKNDFATGAILRVDGGEGLLGGQL